MVNNCYTEQLAKRVIVSGPRRYEAARQRVAKSGVRMHRSAKSGAEGRNLKKLLSKTSPYKERDAEAAGGVESDGEPYDRFLITPPKRTQQESKAMSPWDSKGGGEVDNAEVKKKEAQRKATSLTSVLFVEQTPGGMYAARLRETEEKLTPIINFRVKIVEKSGTTLKSVLVRSDPWAGGKCGRKRCLPCEAGVDNSKCRKINILYESTCQECLREGEDFTYVGESSRSGYERGMNHLDDYKARHEDSHM